MNQGQRKRASRTRRRTWLPFAGLLVAAAVVGACLGVWRARSGPDFGRLVGRWVRPDGGYILVVNAVDRTGNVSAAYLNPNPITVSRANATRQGRVIGLTVELTGGNYSGSRYDLVHDPQSDRLIGWYHQASFGGLYDVVFEKVK